MKVSGWHLQRLVAEAELELVGGRVEQIRSYRDRTRLLFVLESSRGKLYLHLGVRGEGSGFYWESSPAHRETVAAAARTEAFNRLREARVIGVGMPSNDRVLRLEFDKDSATGHRRFSLVAGWFGGQSNVWLLDPDGDEILEVLHSNSTTRSPNQPTPKTFSFPAPKRLADWQSISFAEYQALREGHEEFSFSEFLRNQFWGIDAPLAELVAAMSKPEVAADYHAEFDAMKINVQRVIDPETPLMLRDTSTGSVLEFSPRSQGGSYLSDLLAQWDQEEYAQQDERADLKRVSDAVNTALKKLSRRLESLDRSLSEAPRVEAYRREADLLGSHRDELNRGMEQITVVDFDGISNVTIKLNPARSPQQNIEDFYRKSRKLADALANATAERPAIAAQHARLREIADRLAQPESTEAAIQEAQSFLGISELPAPRTKRLAPRLPYREFKLGAHRLWVGRSSKDNDELTMKHTRPEDLFFHVHGAPGSHVILKRESKEQEFDKATLLAAAQVAAFFSKAKHAGLVPVVYAEARYVRKPRKAPAGTVTVEREKSLMVRPLPPPGYHESSSGS